MADHLAHWDPAVRELVAREVAAAVRGIRFRVETACDGYAHLTEADVHYEVLCEEDYIEGARAASQAIRAALGDTPREVQP